MLNIPTPLVAVILTLFAIVAMFWMQPAIEWCRCASRAGTGWIKRWLRRKRGIRSPRVEFPKEVRDEIMAAHKWCRYCRFWSRILIKRKEPSPYGRTRRQRAGRAHQADHIAATSAGALANVENGQRLCGRCNGKKSGDGGPIRHANRVMFGAVAPWI